MIASRFPPSQHHDVLLLLYAYVQRYTPSFYLYILAY